MEIAIEKVEIEKIADDAVRVEIHKNETLTALDIEDIVTELGIMFGNTNKVYVMSVFKDGATIDESAREYSTTSESNRQTLADAAVIGSLAQKMIGNFYIRINKPPVPTRLFNNETDALRWFDKLRETSETS